MTHARTRRQKPSDLIRRSFYLDAMKKLRRALAQRDALAVRTDAQRDVIACLQRRDRER